MLDAARTTTASAVLVATETGMLHQLRRANPAVRWEPVNPDAVCRYMKMTTPASLLRCLREGIEEVTVPLDVARRARRAVQACCDRARTPPPALVADALGPRSRRGGRRIGAAGMTAALTAARHGRDVLLLTKEDIGGGATPLAQGGLAAAIGPGDDPGLHERDTLDAGAGLCDPAAVAALASQAPGEIARLCGRGARLEQTALHLEAGHSRSGS